MIYEGGSADVCRRLPRIFFFPAQKPEDPVHPTTPVSATLSDTSAAGPWRAPRASGAALR